MTESATMVNPIPDNVKAILEQLERSQQITLQTYIASLRGEIKDLKQELLAKQDADSHAHYHGHELCTHDHGHSETDHTERTQTGSHVHEHGGGHQQSKHGHGNDHNHKHDHNHGEHCKHESHNHKHHEHKHTDGEQKSKSSHEHSHKHAEDVKPESGDNEVPAWKKQVMEADPSAAPFGGSWNTESNLSAKES